MVKRKIEVGDVFEIDTPIGKSYLHYIYVDNDGIELVRVLQGLYFEPPKDLNALILSKERYMVSFPLSAAVRKKIVKKIGFYSCQNFERPKYMRIEHYIRGEFLGWYIVDTDSLQRQLINNLTAEQKKLSPWGIWNDTLLKERLVSDWSLEDWG